MKKITKIIGVLSVASLMCTSAFSQITITGYAEVGMIQGSAKGNAANSSSSSKGFGSDTTLVIASKGKMTNGMEYDVNQTLQSDVVGNGIDTANSSPMTTRNIRLLPNKDVVLFYTYDGVYGGEIARTAIPILTERPTDISGLSGLSEFIDVTSGGHAVGFDVLNLGPAGRFSVAYNPNFSTTQSSTSDRTYAATNYISGLNNSSGYSFGYSVTPGPIKVALGYTKIDAKSSATAVDPKSATLGVQYTMAPLAVGAQRTKNQDGIKKVGTVALDDTVDSVSLTFAASKEISLGAIYSQMEREVAGSTTGPKTKTLHIVSSYNLGPVVASIAYEDAKDKTGAATAVTVAGHDSKVTKLKVKANF